jgi:hypothetical protein
VSWNAGAYPPLSYGTNFAGANQNPISEGTAWVHQSSSWAFIDILNDGVSPNRAVGSQTGTSGHDDDSYAYLSPSLTFGKPLGFKPNYQITATIYKDPSGTYINGDNEVELLLRMSDVFGGNTTTCYECTWSVGGDYNDIVIWNGPLDNFTILNANGAFTAPQTGDQIRAKIVGNTITTYINYAVANGGTGLWQQLASITNSTYTTGQPGIGMWFLLGGGNSVADRSKFGLTHWDVTEI